MKIIIALFFYHLFLIGAGTYTYFFLGKNSLCEINAIWVNVALLGLIGGSTYCMRALYLQYCVKKEWDNRWITWQIIRPFVSTVCGVVSLLFVKAGLLLFEASSLEASNHYGIYALAFIAGLNVDNFIKRIESISKEIFGIEKTNVSGGK